MIKVVKHGQFYQEKKKITGIPYVKCPECNSRIFCDLDYPKLLICECGCEFEFEYEDVEYLYEEE